LFVGDSETESVFLVLTDGTGRAAVALEGKKGGGGAISIRGKEGAGGLDAGVMEDGNREIRVIGNEGAQIGLEVRGEGEAVVFIVDAKGRLRGELAMDKSGKLSGRILDEGGEVLRKFP